MISRSRLYLWLALATIKLTVEENLKGQSSSGLKLKRQSSFCYPSPIQHLPLPKISFEEYQNENEWWCDQSDESAWLGFSYDVSDCPSRAQMAVAFKWMRNVKKARYVRIYSACDATPFNRDLIEAAAQTGVGVYALIWFGFDGDGKWKARKQALLREIKVNQKAPYVIRAVTLGSEPLYDNVLPVNDLIYQLKDLKRQLSSLSIKVTLSEMPSGYMSHQNTSGIFEAVDFVSLHSFAFFEQSATTAEKVGPVLERDVHYGLREGKGKKVVITQTGWPSNMNIWKANSPKAVASIAQEKAYFSKLNDYCEYFSDRQIGWFSH
ncbi:hypothetical protein O181_075200, partial [Austropuccinia psidii MF-1]|nr:hypothetical protein [Austropuccinia psidii MF-1]